MIYKQQSAKVIIGKVFRDTQIQRSDWINDAIEWMGEALDAIGSFPQLESKSQIKKTFSHSVPIPRDLVIVNSIYYGEGNDTDEEPSREDLNELLAYGSHERHPSFVPSDEDTSQVNPLKKESFIITGGYIKTSFEEDWILINYQAVATDDEGFPLVPDNYEFEQALYWYIVHKLVEGGFKHPAGLNYFHVRDLWLDYCGKARNKANMPDSSQMERIKEIWVGLLPSVEYTPSRDKSELEEVNASNLVTRPLTTDDD